MPRFDVDTAGFRDQQKGREPFRIIQEIFANSFDEKTAKNISASIFYSTGSKKLLYVHVTDDGDGFKRIQDVYTLFGRSEKIENPEQRGRWNLGEKQFFALAEKATIETSGKHIEFSEDTRTEVDKKTTGTMIEAWFRFETNCLDEIMRKLNLLIVPQDKHLVINGKTISTKKPIRRFSAVLTTLQPSKSDPRVLIHTNRTTTIAAYEPSSEAWLFEMGIPIQPIECLWSLDVQQKVPLSPNRDTVSDQYLKKLYSEVVNNMHNLIPKEEAGKNFVTLGLGGATAASAKDILSKRFDSNSVVLRSADYRANEAAMEDGAFVVPDGVFDTDTRKHLKEVGVANYAAELYKTEFVAAKPVSVAPEMQCFARFVNEIAIDTIARQVECVFISAESDTVAQYSRASGTMTFNVGHKNVRGPRWFVIPTVENLGTVIHELSHHDSESGNGLSHLTTDFVYEQERIAATIALKGAQYYWDKSA